MSILCRNTLMCGYWNIYVVTLTIVLRQCFCAASSICVATQFFYVAKIFLLVLIATVFLVLSAFLSRPGKSVVIESCLHLT